MHEMIFENRQNKFDLGEGLFKTYHRILETALEYEGIESYCEVSLVYVDNDQIQAINKEFRNKDCATDVLSFPQYEGLKDMDEVDEEMVLGDIVISVEKAAEQAKTFGHTLEREMCYLFTHSVFHLFGYDHESDEEKTEMRKLEEWVLNQLGITRASESSEVPLHDQE